MPKPSAHPARRSVVASLGALACSAWLPGCASEARPITLGLHVWPGYEPTPLARSMGWLDEKQVKIIETSSATDSLALLRQGKIDGAGLTLDEVLRAREHRMDLCVLLVCDISAGADVFLVRPGIKALPDIKGLRVGVEDGALGALMLYQVLQAAGLTLTDIKPVSLAVNQHAAAWKYGEIDAAVTYEPAAKQIIAMGASRLFDSRQIPETIIDVLAVRSAVLDAAHGNALRHLLANHLRALRHLNSNPDDAAYRMAARMNLPPDQVLSEFKGLVLPDLTNNIRLLGTQTPAVLKSATVIGEVMLRAGILRQPASLVGLLRPEFLPRLDA